MENYLPKWDLQILSRTFFDKMYISGFGFKKTFKFKFKNLKSFCGKKDVFDCAGIRAQVFWLPVDQKFQTQLINSKKHYWK